MKTLILLGTLILLSIFLFMIVAGAVLLIIFVNRKARKERQ